MRRRVLGMSQQALAEQLGLTFQQIQKYERGSNRVSASKLYEIARALSATVGHFFEGLPDPSGGEGKPEAARLEGSIRDFLLTPEGMELALLFPRIPQAKLRRQVLEVIRALAEEVPGS